MTQHQLHELLETEPARALLEGAEERGFVLPTELEAFALEHDLADDEVEQLTRELEAIGLEVGEPASEPDDEPQKAREAAEKSAEAEQTRFSLGMSTNYQVLDLQNRLTVSRLTELGRLINYLNAVAEFDRVQRVGR